MRHAIAIDLGGSHASIGIVCDATLLASRNIPLQSQSGLASFLPTLRAQTDELLQQVRLGRADMLGVALSLPSLVDFRTGRVVSVNDKFPDAQTLDLHMWAREALSLPLVVENDARAALLGEAHAGAASGCKDVVMVTLGTGVGCAVLANGVLFRTAQAQGGNLGGHIPVRIDGRQCTCGARGCMESEASGWVLPIVAEELPDFPQSSLAGEHTLTFETLFQHCDAGDTVARQLLEHCIHVWSVGAVGLIHAYGPEKIIFGGGVMARAGDVLPAIQSYVAKYAWTPAGTVAVVPSQLGNLAPLYAAIPLLVEALSLDSTDENT